MARPLRSDPNGEWHHVMNRGARHQAVFLSDFDRLDFLDVLGTTCKRYSVEVHAYCLMGNHYHLLLRCANGNVSQAIQHFASVYTQRFNRRHGFDGALFRGRFHSVPVTSDEQLITVSRYIHRNPKDLGSGVLIEQYEWSSLGFFIRSNRPKPAWLKTALTLRLFGDNPDDYLEFVADRKEAEQASVATISARLTPPAARPVRVAAMRQRSSVSTTVRTAPRAGDKHEPEPP